MTMKELTIEKLAERWEWLRWCEGLERLRVVERFRNEKSFVVHGLSMEIEDDCECYCRDYYDTLVEQFSVLIAFSKHKVKNILLLPLGNGLYREQLCFEDGEIFIEIA